MNTSAEHSYPITADPREAVTRIIRRICVLREQGRDAEAHRLERGELAAALQAWPDHGPVDVADITAAERRRVADAAVLAELLLPQLRAGHPVVPAPDGRATAPDRRPAGRTAVGTPDIGALLDAMLAGDAARPGHSSFRNEPTHHRIP